MVPSLLHLSYFRLTLVFRVPLRRSLLRILGHDVLKVTPQRLDGRKLVSDLCDFLERSIEFIYILQDEFE